MLKLSFILTLAVLYFGTFEETGAIFWPCESAEDCTAVGSSCDADTKLCACANFNSVFSEDFTQCLTTSLFGDTCVDSVQCNLMPSGANCKAGVCDCADGHTYVRGRCRPLNGLDQTCETDLDCYFGYDRNSVSCQDRVCTCANGYYRRYGNICRRKSMEIGDACVVNTDCDEIGSSVKCVSLKCEETGEGATDTPTETPIEPPTETPIEPPTETPIEPSTETPIEPPTETSTEPPLETTTLTDNFLAYNNNNKKISKVNAKSAKFIRSSTSQDSPALQPPLTNGDYRYAQHFTDTETESESETEPLQRNDSRKSREIAVQTSLEAYELKEFGRNVRHVATATASTSTSSRRTSNFNQSFNKNRRRPTFFRFDDDDIKTYSTLSNTDDDADEKKFGSTCTDNGKSCPGLPHSICSNKICFCRQGYYPNNGKCFAELGEIAESTDECEYDFDEISKTCICQKNYFYERDLRSCRKPIQYHLSCTSNSQCSPFGASYCNPQIPRRCTCEQYAEYDELQQMCAYKQGLGAECQTDDGCPVTHSLCSNRICVCKDNFYEKDGACHAGIGAECQADLDCTTENAYCPQPGTSTNSAKESDEQDSKTCQCRRGFVHFKDECLKEAEEIEEVCSENEQCKPLLASCIDRKCSCTDEQHLKNGRCEAKKMLGEACSKATECYVEKDPETVECRNSVCQCQVGYREGEQKTCIRVMPNKKNSSGRPSALKIITFILIGSAFLITSAALKQAYY